MTQTKSIPTGEQTQHTPGPWEIMARNGHMGVGVGRDDKEVATVYLNYMDSSWDWDTTVDRPENEKAKANARLIAAAPELLKVCEAVSSYYGASLDYQPHYLEMARAAIAKAEGK